MGENQAAPIKRVFLNDDHLVLDFPYDATQVRDVKLIPGAKWDRLARVWRAPMTSLNEVREFAVRYEFPIDDDVVTFNLPTPKNVVFGVKATEEWIFCSFNFDPVKVRAIKQIPSITWDATSKAWRAPLTSAREVINWADRFDEVVTDELRCIADKLASQREAALAASRRLEGELEVGDIPLLPYQRAAVEYAAQFRRCFIADDMGLGKTITSIATLEHLAATEHKVFPALIVCPPSLVLNWRKEWNRWAPNREVATITDRKTFPNQNYDVLIVGYSNISHWLKNLAKKHKSVIFDESHYLKTFTAQRTKAAIKIGRSIPADGTVLCLTGTPITNRPAEYAAQLDVMGKLNDFGGRWGFYRRYCNAFQDRFGVWHIDGHSHLDELNDRLRGGGLYIRRTKDQVLHELPPVMHNPIVVEGDTARMREYRRAEADIVAYLVERAKQIAAELGLSPAAAAVRARIAAESAEHMVRLAVLRRLAALAKMPLIEEWVDEHVAAGRKVVLAAHHRDVVDALAVKYGDCRIQGGMTVADVEAAKQRFQEGSVDEAPVMVLSIQAAKTGHTLTAAQDVCFVELPFTPADVDQTYSRCHRLGQQGSVTATYMLTANTVDEYVYDLIEQKRAVVDMATEGTSESAADISVARSLVEGYLQQGLEALE